MAITRIDQLPELTTMDDLDVTLVNSVTSGTGYPVTQFTKGQTIQSNIMNDYELSDTITFVLDGGDATSTTIPEYNANTGFDTGNASFVTTRTL
tara:strand:- start:2568 stop:2849 length:282 start_codon:yes stop_codon:yes gene_type:complete